MRSDGISVLPSALASATAAPETVDRPSPASIVTCARPPRTRPTTALARSISRSMMPAFIISSPARMKNGIDISGNALTAFIIRVGSRLKSTSLADQPGHRGQAEREGERHAEQRDAEEHEDDDQAHSRGAPALAMRRAAGERRSTAGAAPQCRPPTASGDEEPRPRSRRSTPSSRPTGRRRRRRPRQATSAISAAAIAAIDAREDVAQPRRQARGHAAPCRCARRRGCRAGCRGRSTRRT